ncbi:hypothetical protein M0805_004846 [Coniferiporia weirii]|nr:hypothetical protein M0805_004846 [Coniferiporia weirii]
MDAPSMTPERRTAVKVTYANRKRKLSGKTGTSAGGEDPEASESETHSAGGDGADTASSAKDAGLKTDLPRTKRASAARIEGVAGKHNASASDPPKTPARSSKPLSALGPKLTLTSKRRPETPTRLGDGGAGGMPPPASVASASDTSEKPASARAAHTTEAERRAYFEAHPDVMTLEPHRVRCRCCGRWLKLHATQKYALAPWKSHKLLCSSDKPRSKRLRLDADSDAAAGSGVDAEVDDDDASSVAPSACASETTSFSGTGTGRRRTTVEERRRTLEEDELTGEVRSHEVFCSACDKWVKLSGKTQYQLVSWTKHTGRMHGRAAARAGDGAPSSRVREAERKLRLVNDAQAREFGAGRVTCAVCAAEVALSETIPYQLENWLEHKRGCFLPSSPARSAPVSPSIPTPVSPSTEKNLTVSPSVNASPSSSLNARARPPPSTASTEVTCVNPDGAVEAPGEPASPPVPAQIVGQKRARDEGDVVGGEGHGEGEERGGKRRRKGGRWGWLWQPWEAFAKGFAEGFGTGETAPASSGTGAGTGTGTGTEQRAED